MNNLNQFAKGTKKETKGTKNVVIYTRVSSAEQVAGQSLEVQQESCRDYAKKYGYTVLKEFGNDYESAKSDTKRKEFKNMLDYVRKSKQPISYVLVYNTSRFSRTGSTTIIDELKKNNVFVKSTQSGYQPETPDGEFIQHIELGSARYDNNIKRKTTIDNTRKALIKGRWVARVPMGYIQMTTKENQIITINKEGKLIQKAFMWKSEGKSNVSIIECLKKEGLDICKQKLTKIFKNPFYAGYMAHNMLAGEVLKGNHPAIIDLDTFLKINKKQETNTNNNTYELKFDKEYAPLIGSIKCPCCGKKLTASISTKMKKKGRNDVAYYVCGYKGCCFNASTKKVHQAFANKLKNIEMLDTPDNFIQLLKEVFKDENQENKRRATHIKSEISKKKHDLEKMEMNFVTCTDENSKQIYSKHMAKCATEIRDLEEEIEELESTTLNLDNFINFALKIRHNLLYLWELQLLEEKRQLQNLVFPRGFLYDKKNEHIEPILVNTFFALKDCDLDNYRQKKEGFSSQKTEESLSVLGAGLEPAQPIRAKGF